MGTEQELILGERISLKMPRLLIRPLTYDRH